MGERDDVTIMGTEGLICLWNTRGRSSRRQRLLEITQKQIIPKDGKEMLLPVFWRASPQWGTSGQRQKPSWGSLKAWPQAGSPPSCVLKASHSLFLSISLPICRMGREWLPHSCIRENHGCERAYCCSWANRLTLQARQAMGEVGPL